ncbi:MAG: hypothetical protein U1E73_06455 [Planctomycetota bacterium]
MQESLRSPAIAVLVFALVAACTSTSATARVEKILADMPAASIDATPDALRERFAAAKEIRELGTRDRAFAQIALDAASTGQDNLCLETLREVTHLRMRDDHAAKASLLRRRSGALAPARRIATMIADMQLRDAVFAALATEVRS